MGIVADFSKLFAQMILDETNETNVGCIVGSELGYGLLVVFSIFFPFREVGSTVFVAKNTESSIIVKPESIVFYEFVVIVAFKRFLSDFLKYLLLISDFVLVYPLIINSWKGVEFALYLLEFSQFRFIGEFANSFQPNIHWMKGKR